MTGAEAVALTTLEEAVRAAHRRGATMDTPAVRAAARRLLETLDEVLS
jgi:hypothetical protein